MTPDPTLPQPTAADVCRLFVPTPPARALLAPGLAARDYFAALVAAGHLADARRVLAHSLPPRRAVWWAALCLHHAAGEVPFETPEEAGAFDAATRWVVAPSEATRRAAEAAAWLAQPTTAAGVLAMACFLSGGSVSRPGLPPVFAAPHLSGRLCGAVVYLASVRFDPAKYLRHLRDYLAIGQDVAAGRNLPPGRPEPEPWAEPRAAAPDPGAVDRLAGFLAAGPAAGERRPGEVLYTLGTGGRS
ncbi:DUF6931 family protein [Gemmata sp.]|uniref:DUF6931 family protein n=1 Tax=Gemmata sp. TaxID=1914242 RepID=UPI003F6EC566